MGLETGMVHATNFEPPSMQTGKAPTQDGFLHTGIMIGLIETESSVISCYFHKAHKALIGRFLLLTCTTGGS